MPVYVNRTLNLKKIKLIGFDMDYTLVRYNIEIFERLAHQQAVRILVEDFGYPEGIRSLPFDKDRAIVGLVIDTRNGNMLKLSRFGKVKSACHGLEHIHYRKVRDLYQSVAIDLSHPDYIPLDTSFAISYGVLYSQLVDEKSRGMKLPDFRTLAQDIHSAINTAHQDGSIKDIVLDDLDRFVISDPKIPQLLERYADYGKKLMIITNSDYAYTRRILDYSITPHLKSHSHWSEVFDLVVTLADKPLFFQEQRRFLAIDPETGCMKNHEGPVTHGIYQGGWFKKLQNDMGLAGNEILYMGDHIYGDVVAIKKLCDWRTGLVLGDLERELEGIRKAKPIQSQIDELSKKKSRLEREINRLDIARYEGSDPEPGELDRLFENIEGINNRISVLLGEYRSNFNPIWGEVLRSGNEESRYADQIISYACVYMTRISDLFDYSPKTYFRPLRRTMAHEQDE
ncbi:HAD-IG family 5'-nucleotidase [Salinispira pacifica]|uniref:HAD superfamily (Subfamily IG) hydrolase, 5'-nucleotidase n=1 Tax=Salinispira pacifica TaxID=1307761 RepID=V5WI74_9SPIO|nr:HAD-IG family 5'-nucleotidase [Salinispira pacifica]AHC15493.1 HAD superfamily (subfamily IG) hydrolase, 5'-nucleotidase [Salinispira pacifica]